MVLWPLDDIKTSLSKQLTLDCALMFSLLMEVDEKQTPLTWYPSTFRFLQILPHALFLGLEKVLFNIPHTSIVLNKCNV